MIHGINHPLLTKAIVKSRLVVLNAGTVLLAGLAIAVSGCGNGMSERDIKAIIQSINDCNGKRLANLYAMYQERSVSFQGPPDEKTFKKFIAGISPMQLESMGISVGNIDTLFVSERDGKPFDIRYGASWVAGPGGHQAVIFESQDSSGRVAVYMTGVKVVQVDAAEVAAFKKGERDERPAMTNEFPAVVKRSPGPG